MVSARLGMRRRTLHGRSRCSVLRILRVEFVVFRTKRSRIGNVVFRVVAGIFRFISCLCELRVPSRNYLRHRCRYHRRRRNPGRLYCGRKLHLTQQSVAYRVGDTSVPNVRLLQYIYHGHVYIRRRGGDEGMGALPFNGPAATLELRLCDVHIQWRAIHLRWKQCVRVSPRRFPRLHRVPADTHRRRHTSWGRVDSCLLRLFVVSCLFLKFCRLLRKRRC